ncbi:GNAT family N-acetyltransferase [Sulfobacillus thermosulfidooxidans]|uniref:GNAT family N-acetyltransferase n=1 Tax=Sulfobacillus thermosulfidooxidans TaxID=28034 RepID=UPI0003072F2D|nr:GNAT family N-acetyltransferase [Sulfobacillus thermosulfidooxidans]
MMAIQKANEHDVLGICRVCQESYWETYTGLLPSSYISRIVDQFYQPPRILSEVKRHEWWVAKDNDTVLGAGSGGMTGAGVCELFVLYVDISWRYHGIGSRLLDAITEECRAQGGKSQWVSVTPGNLKGIPFYESRGFVFQEVIPAYAQIDGENLVSLRYMRRI